MRAAVNIGLAMVMMVVIEAAAQSGAVFLGVDPSDELTLLLVSKLAFAVAIVLVVVATGSVRAVGFAGGLAFWAWWRLWPLWIFTGLAAIQGFQGLSLARLGGWLVVALAVAVGEETVFRGLIPASLDPRLPIRQVVLSALLFGAIHLVGLTAQIDPHVIFAQAVLTFGVGILLAAVRLLTGSIWPGLIAHAAMDFFGIAAADGVIAALAPTEQELSYLVAGGVISMIWGFRQARQLV